MGYSGLSSWGDSDNAAAAMLDASEALAKSLTKSLKEKGNEFNTEGVVDVALFFESFVVPTGDNYTSSEKMVALANKLVKKLEKLIKQSKKADCWDGAENKRMHIHAYQRMLKNVSKFLARVE